MGQFIKFTFASCLGMFLAMILFFFLLVMIGVGAASSTKSVKVADKSVLELDLSYAVPEQTNNVAPQYFQFSQTDVLGIQDILRLIRAATDDPKISGIYLTPVRTNLGTVQTADLTAALNEFRESGKWILSYAPYYSQGPYALAAQADTIMLNPIGSVDFRGYAAFIPFFKELLDKTGIKMQIYYAGDFKSATEPFRRTEMSDENRLQTREFLDEAYGQYLKLISDGRGIDQIRLREIAYEFKSRNAEDALALNLVDLIAHEDEAMAWMRRRLDLAEDKKIEFLSLTKYRQSGPIPSGSSRDRIAVVYAEGEILPGKADYGQIGDERYTEILSGLRTNDRVKAVVLRINSPGGSILAAENIYREIDLLRAAEKPVVVSMGDFCASGGYYISALADSIFAQPTTLTGSIGVYTLVPNPHALLNDKLGVRFDTVRTGEYSASFTPFYPWTEREDMYFQQRTDEYYDLFLRRVGKGRKLTREEVHEVAKGRIWSGERAVSLGLVDRIGDLDAAISAAARLAEIEDYRTTEYPRVLSPLNKLIQEITKQEMSTAAERFIEHKINERIPHFHTIKSFLSSPDPLARLPVIFDF